MKESGLKGRILRKFGIRSKSTEKLKSQPLDPPIGRPPLPQHEVAITQGRPPLPSYQYKPLEPDQIRLLILLFKPPIRIDDIVCALYTTKLIGDREHPTLPFNLDYNAVSYAWDQDQSLYGCEKHYIPCIEVRNDESGEGLSFDKPIKPTSCIAVSTSMRQMLLNLLDAVHGSSGPSPLDTDDASIILKAYWIDQVCINQADIAEKSAQVCNMHNIYYCAGRTLAYLGESDRITELAIKTARVLAGLKGKPAEEIPRLRDRDDDLGPLLDWSRLGLDTSQNDPFMAFANSLLGRSWFKRTWVLQELIVSTIPVVICGSTFIRWSWLVDACRVANREGLSTNYRFHSTMNLIPGLEDIRQHYVTFRRILKSQSTADEDVQKLLLSMLCRSLPFIFNLVTTRRATDPRDKVFAVLNFASEMMISADRKKEIINYDSPLKLVYIQATELWYTGGDLPGSIQNHSFAGASHRSIAFLDYMLNHKENEALGLPSWVPSWDIKRGGGVLESSSFKAGTKESPVIAFPPFSLFSAPQVPLTIRGIRLLSTHSACQAVWDAFGYDHNPGDPYPTHCEMLNAFADPYPTTSRPYIDCYRDAVYPEGCNFKCSAERTSTFWEYKKLGAKRVTRARNAQYTADLAKSSLPLLMGLQSEHIATTKFVATGHTFFVSKEGFMGLGPVGMKTRDEVCLFFGGAKLYVIRKINGRHYKFIGPCYVYGLMGAEAYDGHPAETREDFVLV